MPTTQAQARNDEPHGLKALGPGLVTGASDDDPSGIGTYSQVGAQFGLQLLWVMVLSYPLMVAVQMISAQVGLVTGRGLAASLRQHLPRWVLLPLIGLLLVANAINIGADLGAMGAAATLLVGGPAGVYTAVFGVVSLLLQVFVPYDRYVGPLKWLTLSLLAYVAIVFVVDVPWGEVLRHAFIPSLPSGRDGITALVAVLGTTISPYLFFWQASQEVEEQKAAPGERPLLRAPKQAHRQLGRMRYDTYIGMAASNIVAFFIILATAVTLHAHGVHDIDSAAQAAKALAPAAGRFASWLFAAGIIGTGLLAIPVLAGAAGYAVADTMAWRSGLQRSARSAWRFYAVIAVATLAGVAMNLAHVNPMKALYWTAVINGVIAVPILVALMHIATMKSVMGKFTLRPWLRIGGWITIIAMGACAAAMAFT